MNMYFAAKLPKNYDLSATPDPERWLPRRERSYYKGKRRDKRKDIGTVFGSFGLPAKEPYTIILSPSSLLASLASSSVHTSPSHRCKHRDLIFGIHMWRRAVHLALWVDPIVT